MTYPLLLLALVRPGAQQRPAPAGGFEAAKGGGAAPPAASAAVPCAVGGGVGSCGRPGTAPGVPPGGANGGAGGGVAIAGGDATSGISSDFGSGRRNRCSSLVSCSLPSLHVTRYVGRLQATHSSWLP